eukprot:5382192-Pyramimonas_sp.AAC.1
MKNIERFQKLPAEVLEDPDHPVVLAEQVLQEVRNGLGGPSIAKQLPRGRLPRQAVGERTIARGRFQAWPGVSKPTILRERNVFEVLPEKFQMMHLLRPESLHPLILALDLVAE